MKGALLGFNTMPECLGGSFGFGATGWPGATDAPPGVGTSYELTAMPECLGGSFGLGRWGGPGRPMRLLASAHPTCRPADRERTVIRLGQANADTLLGCRRRHLLMRQKTGPHDRLGLESEDNFFGYTVARGLAFSVQPTVLVQFWGPLMGSSGRIPQGFDLCFR